MKIIHKVVSHETGISMERIKIVTRKREVVKARQLCMYFSEQMTVASLADIGEYFGGKDHATVLHAKKAINNLFDTERNFRGLCNTIRSRLEQYASNKFDKILVCENCGSDSVMMKVWVDPNNNAIVDDSNIDKNDRWCNTCEASTKFMTRSDFRNNRKKIKELSEQEEYQKLSHEERFIELTKHM